VAQDARVGWKDLVLYRDHVGDCCFLSSSKGGNCSNVQRDIPDGYYTGCVFLSGIQKDKQGFGK